MEPRRSGRTPKRKLTAAAEYQEEWGKRAYRKCEKAGCPSDRPSCFAKACSGCVRDGYTSRWYHVSNGEHFCNECFEHFYRSYKDGNARFSDWKLKTAANCQKELSIKLFFAEEILNYWTICAKCQKWRSATDDVINEGVTNQSWQCSKANGWNCSDEEFHDVSEAKSISWLNTLSYPPLLKFSSPFQELKEYYPDGIGFSALSLHDNKENGVDERGSKFIKPFYTPDDAQKAGCYSPDVMLPEERAAFPALVKQPSIYLGLRNLVLSLWNSNFKTFHSIETCMPHVVIRGLARVTFCEILKDVLDFLTLRGRINFGIMDDIPRDTFLNKQFSKCSVIIIGAGFSGLSAARQLERAGCQVKVLEARESIGGRVEDDNSLGICISKGPQIITGCINNPMYIMCQQIDAPLKILRPKCNLINSKGDVAEEEIDQKVEFYFNMMLESIEELKNDEEAQSKNLSLNDCMESRIKELETQIYRELTEEEKCLLQFHLANLEYACGASLQDVSALHWNQNESMVQFSGEHSWVEKGFGPLIERLSRGLDMKLNCQVTEIDYSGDKVQITNQNGEKQSADKVIVSVPLAILKKDVIKFKPSLPESKTSAVNSLGAGHIEKVIMKFKKDFWKMKMEKADYCGLIPDSSEKRGFSYLFYDVSNKSNYVLMALLAGDAIKDIKGISDQEVIDRCLSNLKKMFPDQDIPEPTSYIVSHWNTEKHIEMTYSYVGLNATGEDYSNLAETIDDKIYFAGEATNRHFPQTVTGAFISGIREARKILTIDS
eukprot:Seg2517.4 transcript_id=Seg2517.4/GoldUCD/mRNA.D3Y31 product="Lysine-specific histone demethylase 1B" protein_id=Seg2517.4/GoldUCD/D3Y31